MKDQFVTYELAVKLRELGFNEPCIGVYIRDTKEIRNHFNYETGSFEVKNSEVHPTKGKCTAPLWQQVFDWIEEKYELYSYIEPVVVEKAASRIKFDWVILSEKHEAKQVDSLPYHTKLEARVSCLEELIKSIEDENIEKGS